MIACEDEIRDAVEAELEAATEERAKFASHYEACVIVKEIAGNAKDDLYACSDSIACMWHASKEGNLSRFLDYCNWLEKDAERLAQTACKLSAMAAKVLQDHWEERI